MTIVIAVPVRRDYTTVLVGIVGLLSFMSLALVLRRRQNATSSTPRRRRSRRP